MERYYKVPYGKPNESNELILLMFGGFSREVSFYYFLCNYTSFLEESKSEKMIVSNGKSFFRISEKDLQDKSFMFRQELRTILNNCKDAGVVETFRLEGDRVLYYRAVPEEEFDLAKINPDRSKLAGLFDDEDHVSIDSDLAEQLKSKKKKLPKKKETINVDLVEKFTPEDMCYYVTREFKAAGIKFFSFNENSGKIKDIVKLYDATTIRKAVKYVLRDEYVLPEGWTGKIAPHIVTTSWFKNVVDEMNGENKIKKGVNSAELERHNKMAEELMAKAHKSKRG